MPGQENRHARSTTRSYLWQKPTRFWSLPTASDILCNGSKRQVGNDNGAVCNILHYLYQEDGVHMLKLKHTMVDSNGLTWPMLPVSTRSCGCVLSTLLLLCLLYVELYLTLCTLHRFRAFYSLPIPTQASPLSGAFLYISP